MKGLLSDTILINPGQCATHNGRSWRQTLTNYSPCWHSLIELRTVGQKVSWTGLIMLQVSCPMLKSADRLFLWWHYYVIVLFDTSYKNWDCKKVLEFSAIGIKCREPEMVFSISSLLNKFPGGFTNIKMTFSKSRIFPLKFCHSFSCESTPTCCTRDIS